MNAGAILLKEKDKRSGHPEYVADVVSFDVVSSSAWHLSQSRSHDTEPGFALESCSVGLCSRVVVCLASVKRMQSEKLLLSDLHHRCITF